MTRLMTWWAMWKTKIVLKTMNQATHQQQKVKHKKNTSQMESTEQHLWKECIRVLKTPEDPIPSRDVSSRFGNYVAEKIAGFDAKTRAVAEKRIVDVLFEFEFVPNV